MLKNNECKNCTEYKGDCGHHMKDAKGHIMYDVPKQSCCDRYGDCSYFKDNRSLLEVSVQYLKDCIEATIFNKAFGEEILKHIKTYPEHCGEDADCSGCECERRDGGCKVIEGEELHLSVGIDCLREELSRGCEYSATQDIVHSNFYKAMASLGATGDWDEMAAEDLTGQMVEIQSLIEEFYDNTIESIMNYIESYKEDE